MALNIKNPEVVGLIRELARARNVDMTEAIRQAVEHELAGEAKHKELRVRRMRAIEARLDAMPDLGGPTLEELLYDEDGLPK